MIEAVIQHDARDRDAEHALVGEVGQSAGRMLLPEHHVLLGAGQRPPRADTPFERAPNAGTDLGMAPPDLSQDGNRAQSRRRFEDRHDLAVPHLGERIGSPPATRSLLL